MYKQYSLIGLDGNIFNILGYTTEVMRQTRFSPKEREDFLNEMTSGKYDYDMIIAHCDEKIHEANKRICERYYVNNEEEEDDEW